MPEVRELAEKLEAEGAKMGQEDLRNLGRPRDTSEFYEALARVALEFCEEREKERGVGDLIKAPKDTRNCPGLMGDNQK